MIFKGVIVFTTPMMEGNKNESNKRVVHLIYAVMGADPYRGTQQNSCRFWGGYPLYFYLFFIFIISSYLIILLYFLHYP